MNRVRLAPVALAHAIVKYALTAGRGSRYGCSGATGGAVAGREMSDATWTEPTLPADVWRVFDEREKVDAVASVADEGDPGAATGVVGVDATARPSGGWGMDTTDPLCEYALRAEGGRGIEADEVARVRKWPLWCGCGGSMPPVGAEDGGMGSTVDCRWRYIPSWTPFLRTTWT